MERINNQQIVFRLPEETTMVDTMFDILRNNGLEESQREAYEKSKAGKDSKLIIIRDAAIVLFEKKAPENKVVELLTEHLETSPETAQKIVAEINQKLIPYAKVISDEEPKRIPTPRPAAPLEKLPYSKTVEIKDVEENAKNMERKNMERPEPPQKAKTVIPQPTQQPKPEGGAPDAYREPIE